MRSAALAGHFGVFGAIQTRFGYRRELGSFGGNSVIQRNEDFKFAGLFLGEICYPGEGLKKRRGRESKMNWLIVEDALRDRKGHWLECISTFVRSLRGYRGQALIFDIQGS